MSIDAFCRRVDVAMGLIGKCLQEELNHHPCHVDYHRAYKQRHPRKVVLLHFNAKGRHPRFGFESFHAGHWLYFNGCRILDDLPASQEDITVRVEDPSLFKTNYGHTGLGCDDIGICALDADGKPDWSRAEQTRLLAVDPEAGKVTLQRGQSAARTAAMSMASRSSAMGPSISSAHYADGFLKRNSFWRTPHHMCSEPWAFWTGSRSRAGRQRRLRPLPFRCREPLPRKHIPASQSRTVR
jgi:hypothetical protein